MLPQITAAASRGLMTVCRMCAERYGHVPAQPLDLLSNGLRKGQTSWRHKARLQRSIDVPLLSFSLEKN